MNVTPLASASALGLAVVTVSAGAQAVRRWRPVAGLAGAALAGALVLAGAGRGLGWVAGAVVLVVALSVPGLTDRLLVAASAAGGAAALVVAAGWPDTGWWTLAGGAGLAAAATVARPSSRLAAVPASVLVVPGLAVAVPAALGLAGTGVVAGGAVVAVLAAAAGWPAAALAGSAVAAAGAGLGGPGWVLAAGAVVGLALGEDVPAAAISVLGLPGVTAVAAALAAAGDTSNRSVVLVGGLAATAAVTLARAGQLHRRWLPAWPRLPAAAASAWLLLAPGTWGWPGPLRLGSYDRGAAVAVAAGAVALVAPALRSVRRHG